MLVVRAVRNQLVVLQYELDTAIDQGKQLPECWWAEYRAVSEAVEDEEYKTAIEEEAEGMLGEDW